MTDIRIAKAHKEYTDSWWDSEESRDFYREELGKIEVIIKKERTDKFIAHAKSLLPSVKIDWDLWRKDFEEWHRENFTHPTMMTDKQYVEHELGQCTSEAMILYDREVWSIIELADNHYIADGRTREEAWANAAKFCREYS